MIITIFKLINDYKGNIEPKNNFKKLIIMKKTVLLFMALLGLLLSSEQQFAQTIWTLDFETATGYTTSTPEFTDGSADYFIRTDGTDHGSWVVYNGAIGTYYFAGMDLDGEGATLPLYLDIDDINIAGQTVLDFRVYLAEDDDGANQDWDLADYVHFGYDVDNTGTFTPLLWIESETGGTGSNLTPRIDTDFDGDGDGTEITENFVQFSVPISLSGSLMDIQIEFNLNSGDEDIAIDHMELVVGGGPLPLNANFNADQTNVLTGTTVNFTDMTSGGTLPYSYAWDLDGDGAFDDAFVANPSFMYNTAGTYDVSLRVTDDDTDVDTETKVGYITVITPIEVANLAALRAGTVGEIYKVTGEVVLTYQMSFRSQKYIQDGSAGILIDDDPGTITTTYNLYDGITGLVGTLGEYNNMTQFVPFTDPGTATSTGNTITPEVVTIDDLQDSFDDYEAELVKLLDVSFTDAGALFVNGTVYPISDGSKAFGEFRTTFYNEDYIGTTIPASADITVLPNARDIGNYVTCRTLADFETDANPATQLAITSVNGGFDPFVNTGFSVVVQAQDAGGVPAIVTGDVNFNFTTNDPFSVDFTVSSTLTGTIVSGTSQITVTGVQMAPGGIDVTITAKDDNLFTGLTSGTSDFFDVIELVIPDLIICEIMCDPVAVDDAVGEWFEVYNNGATEVDLLGLVIKDNDYDSTTIDASVVVPPGGFVVLGRNDDPLLNGDYACDYMYTGIAMGNSADEVVLCMPDGLTEIDRVEFDGGPNWPDPTGTTMTFHGFTSNDNNNGANWTYATFREASYVGDEGDRGTPGTEGYDQIITGNGFKLDLKVLLEGPYNVVNDSMTNDLRAQGFVPLNQPFNPATPYNGNNNPKWQYTGTETVSYFPFNGTDWILVELRDAASAGAAGSGEMIAQYPAYVMIDGTVVSLNGSTPLNIKDTYSNDLYVVIWQRNHLGIMTASGLNPADETIESYDFTTGEAQVHNGDAGYKELEPGTWGMIAGDVDADGSVDGSDKVDGWATDAAKAGYLGGDLDLNGQSSNQDKNEFWVPNFGKTSSVPN